MTGAVFFSCRMAMLLVQSHIYKIYIRQVDLNRLGLEGFAYLLAAAKGTDTQNRTSYVSYTIHRKFVHSKKLDIGVVFVFVILRVAKRSRRIHDFTGILDPATTRRMTAALFSVRRSRRIHLAMPAQASHKIRDNRRNHPHPVGDCG